MKLRLWSKMNTSRQFGRTDFRTVPVLRWSLVFGAVLVALLAAPILRPQAAWADQVTRGDAARKQLQKAAEALRAGKSAEDVLAAFRSVVEIDPNLAEGRAGYGAALFALEQYSEADVQFTWAVSLAPSNPEYKHALGVTKLQLGQSSQAVGFLSEASRLAPKNDDYRFGLLLGYIQVGRWDRAIEMWKSGALKSADTAEKTAVTIVLKAIEDNEDEALALAVLAARKFTDEPVFPFLVGLIYEGQGRQEDAIRAYEDAIKQFPDSYDLHRILVIMYLESGYYRKAEQLIKRYLKDPQLRVKVPTEDKVQGVYEIANAQYQTGNYKVSKRSYGQYRKLFEKYREKMGRTDEPSTIGVDALAHFANGIIEERKGQFPRAVTEYELAIKGDPNFLLAYERLGQSFLLQSELTDLKERPPLLRKAKEILEVALELKRDNPAVYLLLGNATYQLALIEEGQFRQGLLREALFLFGQADLGLRDKYAVRIFQAKISDTLGEYRQALKYYEDALKFRARDADVHMLVGHSNIKLRQYPQAVTGFQKSVEFGGDQRDAALGIALAYERMAQPEVADEWYERADQAAAGRKWYVKGQPMPGRASTAQAASVEPEPAAAAVSGASDAEGSDPTATENPETEASPESNTSESGGADGAGDQSN